MVLCYHHSSFTMVPRQMLQTMVVVWFNHIVILRLNYGRTVVKPWLNNYIWIVFELWFMVHGCTMYGYHGSTVVQSWAKENRRINANDHICSAARRYNVPGYHWCRGRLVGCISSDHYNRSRHVNDDTCNSNVWADLTWGIQGWIYWALGASHQTF